MPPPTPPESGPRGLPLVGVALAMRRDPLRYFVDLMAEYGDVVRFRIGTAPVVMLNRPEHIRHVLQDNHANYHKSRFYRAFRPLLGEGIFLSEDREWLEQRRTANPSFAGARFARMTDAVAGAAEAMLERWSSLDQASGGTIALMPEMMRVTLDAVTRALFGLDLVDEHAVLHEAFTVILRHTERRVWSAAPLPEGLYIRLHGDYREALATLDAVVWRLIEDRRRSPRQQDDLLTAFLAAYDRDGAGAPKVLRDQVVSMIAAGHESTACALAWTFCLLSRHPEAEARLRDEAEAVLGGRAASAADLPRLGYARAVFEESMRLYPPVWTISRTALADDRTDGVTIAKGETVMLSPYAVHRHPAYWDNPEGFDPGRFASGPPSGAARYAYFPFGGGPRVCLGNRFAIMEAQVILAAVVQRWRLSLLPGATLEPEPMITLLPRQATWMRLDRRAEATAAPSADAAVSAG